ncbi:MAG: hypothetical protein L3J34_12805 [Flavobacteriaceae bacterium]|nr:hypothetical protein [Flavobacteriaceae bacterium]
MKLQLLSLIFFASFVGFAQVGIGTTTPDPSAALDISATDKGFLMPRMTTVQREAIVNPANSLMVFDTDTNTYWSYVASAWIEALPGGGKFVDGAAPDIAYYQDRVGIGLKTFSTGHKLFVESIKDTDGSHAAVRFNAAYEGTGTATTTYGLAAFSQNRSTATIDFAIGTQGVVENLNTAGTINTAVGSWSELLNNGNVGWGSGLVSDTYNDAGTMTSATGHSINVYNRAGANMGEVTLSSMYMENTGAVTGDAYGLWIGGASTGSVAGTAYAFYIDTPFTNITGNNFALYSPNVGDSYFNGNVGFGIEAPLQKVHISGVMRLEPLAAAPTGAMGDLYVGTDGNLYFHNGTEWREVQLVP